MGYKATLYSPLHFSTKLKLHQESLFTKKLYFSNTRKCPNAELPQIEP